MRRAAPRQYAGRNRRGHAHTGSGGRLKPPAILPTAAYYSLTYGQLDGKTRILTNRGETTGPLPKYPAKPTASGAFRYQRKFDIWLFESACSAARQRRDTAGLIRFSQALTYARRVKLKWGKPGGIAEADTVLAEQYLFAVPPPPFTPDPFFTDSTETDPC